MPAWSKVWASPGQRFLIAVLILGLSFSTLLVEPILVRRFGVPVTLQVQGYASPGFDSFFQLPLTEVPVEELPLALQSAFLLEDLDAAIEILAQPRYFIEIAPVNGVYERVAIHTEEPTGLYIEASFGWLLWNKNQVSTETWQDRYSGVQLDISMTNRYFVPSSTPRATLLALEQGEWVADFHVYRGKLFLIDPRL